MQTVCLDAPSTRSRPVLDSLPTSFRLRVVPTRRHLKRAGAAMRCSSASIAEYGMTTRPRGRIHGRDSRLAGLEDVLRARLRDQSRLAPRANDLVAVYAASSRSAHAGSLWIAARASNVVTSIRAVARPVPCPTPARADAAALDLGEAVIRGGLTRAAADGARPAPLVLARLDVRARGTAVPRTRAVPDLEPGRRDGMLHWRCLVTSGWQSSALRGGLVSAIVEGRVFGAWLERLRVRSRRAPSLSERFGLASGVAHARRSPCRPRRARLRYPAPSLRRSTDSPSLWVARLAAIAIGWIGVGRTGYRGRSPSWPAHVARPAVDRE